VTRPVNAEALLKPMPGPPDHGERSSLFDDVAQLAEKGARAQMTGDYRMSLTELGKIHRNGGVARGLTPQAAAEAVRIGMARALEVTR